MKFSSYHESESLLILKDTEKARIEQLKNHYAFIDLEVRPDSQSVYQIGIESIIDSLEENPHKISVHHPLNLLKKQNFAICGHNFRRFDASYLFDLYPEVRPWSIIDTLELSVIIRPLQESHRLEKNYKPSEYSSNSPLEDARATQRLLNELVNEFFSKPPILQQAYHWLLTCGNEEADLAYEDFFQQLGIESVASPDWSNLPEAIAMSVDRSYLQWLGENGATQPFEERLCVVALLAWQYERHQMKDAPLYSQWLTHLEVFPSVLARLFPLSSAEFTYHPYLEQFGLKEFRPTQEEAVQAILGGMRPLIVMATGGGKSLCYQLPALMLHEQQRALTVVISPLQALMADQVKDIEEKGLYFATFINGALTAQERKHRLEQLHRGTKGLLYISPEQLRSISIRVLLEERPPALWIIDEAHCISQWGQNFRPDYCYVPKFIQELTQKRNLPLPKLALMTATATAKVRDDIKALFAESNIEINSEIVATGSRENLSYQVIPVNGNKEQVLLKQVQETQQQEECLLIYTSTRKNAERLADLLNEKGITSRYYHGKIQRSDKTEILEAFKSGELNVVVATCAFGMGINRPDVRAVIHHTMSANLENYIQETGRAGRDGKSAVCTLLFDEQDADLIFFLQSLNHLSKIDLENIFLTTRSVRDRVYKKATEADWFWVTVNEIFQGSQFDEAMEQEQKDTKIKVALYHLETFCLIERAENLSTFIDFHLLHDTPQQSFAQFENYHQGKNLSSFQVQQFERLIYAMHLLKHYYQQQKSEAHVPLERLSDESGIEARELKRKIEELKRAGICAVKIPIILQITKGTKGATQSNFERYRQWEQQLLELLLDLQTREDTVQVNLRGVTTRLDPDGTQKLRASTLMDILNGWATRKWLTLKRVGQDVVRLAQIEVMDYLDRHQALARSVIDVSYGKLGDKTGKFLQVEWEFAELLREVNKDTPLFACSSQDLESVLLWLHERKLIRLTEGLNLFQQTLKVRVIPRANITTITRRYPQIEAYYRDEAYRTHLMIEYGQLPTEQQRQQWVQDYFRLQKDDFSQNYIPADLDALYRPVTQSDYHRIMGSLNSVQREIVLADHPAIAVIAGPGSGKTRTIVHRIAYLVKVKRVSPDRILVLAYNRNAVKELRLRLQDLIGQMAFHLRIFTFHGLALALLGRTLGEERKGRQEINFDEILNQACLLIEQGEEDDEETQTRRLKLLGNLEYIFVDEYQDVAEKEYRLIQLVAGFGQSEDTSRSVQTNLCVIGDDDQNIYQFRGTDVKYIIQFEKEYNAKQYLLVENYRSTRPIIEAANHLIAHNQQRCKRTIAEQVRIDSERNEEKGLPVRAYRFQHLTTQAEWIIQQVKRWIDEEIKPNEIALLAHNWDDLGVIRLGLEKMGIDSYALKKEGIPPLVRNYVTDSLLKKLRENPNLVLDSDESVYQRFERFFERGNRLHEPTVQTLLKLAQDIDQERGYGNPDLALPISANEIITAIYEFNHSGEIYLNENAILVTSCHGAKGLEFRKVIFLTDHFDKTEAERRLFYVAMTRAKEDLILCSTKDSQLLKETQVNCQAIKVNYRSISQKNLYLDLTPKDTYLGYKPTLTNQEKIKTLKEGDALQIRVNKWGNGWDILKDGYIIGGLSRLGTSTLQKKGIRPGQFQFQSGEVTVKHIFRWLKTDDLTGNIVDDWFVVISQIRVCR